ncbi:tetratricopeptide repeat protein [Aurantibacter sp.]|uniref:tetratricopeptide repeat protein n=1 Tax=Aurantibacter sp. TaxID=2807103 RepID=UPI0035C7A43E
MRFFIICFLIFSTAFSQNNVEKAKQLLADKSFYKAEQLLKEEIKTHPNNLEVIELLGDAYGHQKKWDNAIIHYKKLKEQKPKVANYHYKFGGAMGMKALVVNKFAALGLIGDVKDAFLTAAKLDPKHIDTRWALVELYMQLPGIIGGSKSKSFKYANELQALSKVDGYLAKGYIYEYDDEPELAEKYYLLAIKEGGSLTCFDKLTNLYEDQNQPEKAVANLEAANVKHKRNAMHYQIGKVCAEYNVQVDKGEKCLLIYLENYSAKDGVPKAWANYRLAQIYKHKKAKSNALKHIDLAILQLPKIKVFKEERKEILTL